MDITQKPHECKTADADAAGTISAAARWRDLAIRAIRQGERLTVEALRDRTMTGEECMPFLRLGIFASGVAGILDESQQPRLTACPTCCDERHARICMSLVRFRLNTSPIGYTDYTASGGAFIKRGICDKCGAVLEYVLTADDQQVVRQANGGRLS